MSKDPTVGIIAFIVIVLIAYAVDAAPAYNNGHPAEHQKLHNEFYSTLVQNDGKTSCCNDKDCRPVKHRMVPDKSLPNGVRYDAFIPSIGWVVPDQDKIQFKTTPDGMAHLCSLDSSNYDLGAGANPLEIYTFCFIIPQGLF